MKAKRSKQESASGKFDGRLREAVVLQAAQQIYELTPDWATFVRQVLGPGGILQTAFPESAEIEAFKRSPEYARIQVMIARLRAHKLNEERRHEATRMITVRLPASLHEILQNEAEQRNISVNKLCITKLLQVIEEYALPPTPVKERKKSTRTVRTRLPLRARIRSGAKSETRTSTKTSTKPSTTAKRTRRAQSQRPPENGEVK